MNNSYTIKILTSGPIKCMGMIHGPILTPYTVDRAKLLMLLNEGLNIVQVNDDKTETKITLRDITAETSTKKAVVKKVSEPVENTESVAVSVAETVVEDVPEITPEIPDKVQQNSKYTGYNKKKNK